MPFRKQPVVLALFAIYGLTDCAQSYRPALSPRVTVMGNGQVVKNGVGYGSLLFGTPDAVANNAHAKSEALAGRNLAVGGLVFGFTGLALGATGIVVDASKDHTSNTGLGWLIGEGVCLLTSIVLISNAGVRARNAVNMYNDKVTPPAEAHDAQ